MDGKGNQGHGGPPHQGRQNGRRRQGRNDGRQQGDQNGPPQPGGSSGNNTDRVGRVNDWLNSPNGPPPPVIQGNQALGNPGRGMFQGPHSNATRFTGNGQPPSLPPAVPHGMRPQNSMDPRIPPMASVPGLPPFGPSYQPPPPLWTNNGAGVLNFSQLGRQGPQLPMYPAPMGNPGNLPGAGAYWPPGQVGQAPGNLQPRQQAPPNAAPSAPANIQQPGGGQPSRKRAAGEEPTDQQPAPKKQAGRGPNGGGPAGGGSGSKPAGEDPPQDQPANGNNASVPANSAPMSLLERLDKDLVNDVADLTRAEEDELLLWAREKNIPWKVILKKYKFTVKESTLRGRHHKLALNGPPREPKFTERDIELLLEAVERLTGGQLDDVDNHNTKALWKRAKEYIREHGAETKAGEATLKDKYRSLIKDKAETREDLKPRKAKQKAIEKSKNQRQKEASLDDNAEDESVGEPSTHGGGDSGKKSNKVQWNHAEYEKYEVEYEDGADFGETEDDNDGNEDDENDEDYKN